MSRTLLTRLFSVVAVALIAVAPAAAQTDPYNPLVYAPYAPAPGASADVIRATGNLPIQQERARLEHERANQAAIQTNRMAFDEGEYELARTPSYLATLDPWTQMQLRRDISQPAESDITHGDTLNLLMPYINALIDQGSPTPAVPLSADTLKAISVQVGTFGPSAGLLRDAGHLCWPLFLRGPAQQEMDRLIPAALGQAEAGNLTPATYTHLMNLLSSMRTDLLTKSVQGAIDRDAVLTSKDFLDNLESSLSVLERPEAATVLTGASAPAANTVPELVEQMSAAGEKFAPATPGSEAAYVALHNAFVSYIRNVEANRFAAKVAPPSHS
jgi:hypothetical protein